jgi:hypothetical protein
VYIAPFAETAPDRAAVVMGESGRRITYKELNEGSIRFARVLYDLGLRPGDHYLSMILGPTDTPAFRRILQGRDFAGIISADDVARQMLASLPEGPTWPPEPSPFGGLARRQAVEMMSQGSAFLGE